MLTSSTKREIRNCHVEVVQWRQRNVQKAWTRAELLFYQSKPVACLPFSLTSPSSVLKFLIKNVIVASGEGNNRNVREANREGVSKNCVSCAKKQFSPRSCLYARILIPWLQRSVLKIPNIKYTVLTVWYGSRDGPLVAQVSPSSYPCEKLVQNPNWVADWLLPFLQGINDVTVNLIGCIEKLHRMILKTGCNYDLHNKQYNPGLLLGDFGFHLSFLEVWLGNLWLNFEIIQANIRQLNERCSRTKLCLNFSYQRTYCEWIWWFPAMLCLAVSVLHSHG